MSRGRRALGVVVVVVSCVAAACSGGSGSELRGEGDERPVDTEAAGAAAVPLLQLAVGLEQQLAAASPGSDLTVAPLPVATALSQVRAGASGTTADELDRVLATPTGPDGAARLATGLSSLDRLLPDRSGEVQAPDGRTGRLSVELASSLWLPRGTNVADGWLDELASTWGTGVRTTDFRSDPETARRAVNGWVARETAGHIDQLAARGSISSTTRLLAATAAYLKAPWASAFAETDTRLLPFHHLDGAVTTTPTMRNPVLGDVRHGTGDGWVAVDLPYLGRDLWMTVVLPDPGRFEEVERALDGGRLDDLVDGLRPATVDLSLPKFGFTTDSPLTDPLRTLGLSEAMDPLAADLGGISPEQLWLSPVLHQTYLAVDEQGTEATATAPRTPATTAATRPGGPATTGRKGTDDTALAAGTTSPATTAPLPTDSRGEAVTASGAVAVTVDRPFLVLVRDRPTGAPLFYGRVLSPNG
jgi:serpin B